MNGCGIIASPPWSWIAFTLSSSDMPRLTGSSRNQARRWVWAGHLVVISCPATTWMPAPSPRCWVSLTEAIVSWSVTAMRSSLAAMAASTSWAGLTMPSEESVWQGGSDPGGPPACRRGGQRSGDGGRRDRFRPPGRYGAHGDRDGVAIRRGAAAPGGAQGLAWQVLLREPPLPALRRCQVLRG